MKLGFSEWRNKKSSKRPSRPRNKRKTYWIQIRTQCIPRVDEPWRLLLLCRKERKLRELREKVAKADKSDPNLEALKKSLAEVEAEAAEALKKKSEIDQKEKVTPDNDPKLKFFYEEDSFLFLHIPATTLECGYDLQGGLFQDHCE